MSNAVLDAIQATTYGESVQTDSFYVETVVEVKVPRAVSQEQIFKALHDHFSQPDASLGLSDGGSCVFRGDGNGSDRTRCAFGVFIPDAVYDRVRNTYGNPEAWGVESWIDRTPELAYLKPHKELLSALQSLHDGSNHEKVQGLTGVPLFLVKLEGAKTLCEQSDFTGFTNPKAPEVPLGLNENVFSQKADSDDDRPF